MGRTGGLYSSGSRAKVSRAARCKPVLFDETKPLTRLLLWIADLDDQRDAADRHGCAGTSCHAKVADVAIRTFSSVATTRG